MSGLQHGCHPFHRLLARNKPQVFSGRGVQGGFSLLELLVVVVLIALLAALVLPAVGRVRASAQAVTCLNRVRQWTFAIWLYTEDHGDAFPYEGNFLVPIDEGANQDAWYNSLPLYHDSPSLSALYHRDLIPMPRDRSIFTCPAVFRPPARKPTPTRSYFMYGFNNRMDPNGPRRFRRGQVRAPDRTVVFTENSEDRFPSTAGRFTPARHRGRANLGFADGHAEGIASNAFARTLQEDVNSRAEWEEDREVYWYPYPGAPQ